MTRLSRKPTWEQTPEQLAQTLAALTGYEGRVGGWVYDPEGRPVAKGWAGFADYATARKWLVPGVGIDWARAPEVK